MDQIWNRVAGHRVSDYVRVGSGLGSKLFTYRPGIVTRFLTEHWEQLNDTAAVSMLGTHERIVHSPGSMNTQSKQVLIASQLAPCPATVSVQVAGRCTTLPSSNDIDNLSRLPHRWLYSNRPPCRLLRPSPVSADVEAGQQILVISASSAESERNFSLEARLLAKIALILAAQQ